MRTYDAAMTLQTKIAMVTGAGLGSGEATAKTLAKTATTLVVADINGGNAKKVAQAITSYQHRAVLLTADAGSVEEIQRRVVAARSKVFEVLRQANSLTTAALAPAAAAWRAARPPRPSEPSCRRR